MKSPAGIALLTCLLGLIFPTAATAKAATSQADLELQSRLSMAAVPGVVFHLAAPRTVGVATAHGVIAPHCQHASAGLCDIHFGSMPKAAVPQPLPTELDPKEWQSARVFLQADSGEPLLLVRPGAVAILMALQPPWSAAAAGAPAQAVPMPPESAIPEAALRRWSYLNYLLHSAACEAAGISPPRLAEWSHAPLPSRSIRTTLVLIGGLLWLLLLGLFRFARHRPALPPESLHWLRSQGPESSAQPQQAGWSQLGFARPLSGLLTLLGSMVLLIGPYFALQSYLGKHVQPFPEADGLWRNTVDTLFLVWLTFDLGTQTAMVKYFAEHRATDPTAALHDVQFYLWYQLLSRLAEATLLTLLALGVLPYSSYALYAPMLLLYSVGCLVSFAGIGKLVSQALQRFDYQNLLDLLESRLLVFLVPIPFVLWGRAWGLRHPDFGEVYGAALGLGVGQLFTQLSTLGIGLWALRRLQVPIGQLFRADFTRATVKRQLSFGIKVTIGQEPFRLTSFLETLIIIKWLADFPSWLGIRDLIHNRLSFLFFFAWSYYQSAVPTISEAIAMGRRRLLTYYVARYLQFGFLFSTLIFSLLLAVGPLFIRVAMGPQWGRAADYLIPGCLSGLLLPLAWLSDSLQQGAGRPGINTAVMLAEQGLRLLLLLLLVPSLQFAGIYVAVLLALILKCCVGWLLNHRLIVRLQTPLWSTWLAPLLAGLLNFAVWKLLCLLLQPAQTYSVLVLFFGAGAGSFVIGFFACGLLGGFEPQALSELKAAAQMSALIRPLALVLYRAAALGARLAPVSAADSALSQAAALELAAPPSDPPSDK